MALMNQKPNKKTTSTKKATTSKKNDQYKKMKKGCNK